MSDLGFQLHDDEDHVAGPRRRTRLLMVIAAPLVLLLIAAAVLIGVLRGGEPDVADFVGEGSGEVRITVASGETLTQIGRSLAAAGVVADHRAFVRAARDEPRATGIVPGVYALREGMSGAAALALLLDPASRLVLRVVVPEGTRTARIADLVATASGEDAEEVRDILRDNDVLRLPEWADGPEGILFPATYQFDAGTTAEQMLAAMVRRFDTAATKVDLVAGARAIGMTPWEIVTIASIIEAEVAPADFGKAARVIYNRLERGMPLQMDSTVNYGLGTSVLMFTDEQLKDDNPYNTYVIRGLPPGPIGSPGEAALRAALAPEDGAWLWFVSVDPDAGVTKFATSEAEFFRFREEFRRWYRDNR